MTFNECLQEAKLSLG